MKYDCDLLDVEPYREMLRVAKTQRRMTFPEMGRLTGIDPKRLNMIENGKTKRIQRKTANAIRSGLADPDRRAFGDRALVPVKLRHRQIVLSLCAQGFTIAHQSEIIQNNGVGNGTIVYNVSRQPKAIMHSLKQLEWLAQAVGNATGPSTRSIQQMRNRGVFPLRHYNLEGKLLVRTLSPEQRRCWERVQSKHGAISGSGDGARSCA